MNVFLAIEGIDGAGKTSAAEALVARLRADGHDVCFARHNSSTGTDPGLRAYLDGLSGLRAVSRDVPYERLGTPHWALIRASYYAVVDHCVVTPALAAGRIVVADGWYYKIVARLAAGRLDPPDGYDDPAHVLPFFARVRAPDRVCLLDVPPGLAARRKREYALGEVGPQNRHTDRPDQAFVAYQTQVRAYLHDMAAALDWTVLDDPTGDGGSTVDLLRAAFEGTPV